MNFAEFMRRVNEILNSIFGGFADSTELDFNYWDSWANGLSPKETAKAAVSWWGGDQLVEEFAL